MAASSKVLLKKPFSTSSKLLNRALLRSARLSSGAPRLFNTSAAAFADSDCSDDEDFGAFSGFDRRSPFASCVISPISSDVFAPMSGRSSREAMQMKEPPAAKGLTSRAAYYSVRDKADGLHLRFEMPGLSKEDVKVTVERKTLVVSGGEAAKTKESAGVNVDEDGAMFMKALLPVKVDLPAKSKKAYKLKEIKAEMKNGVLKVVVPKVKDEERDDVLHVNVQ